MNERRSKAVVVVEMLQLAAILFGTTVSHMVTGTRRPGLTPLVSFMRGPGFFVLVGVMFFWAIATLCFSAAEGGWNRVGTALEVVGWGIFLTLVWNDLRLCSMFFAV